MATFSAPPSHSSASTSSASTSHQPPPPPPPHPPPVQDEVNSRKRPREEDDPLLLEVEAAGEDGQQGAPDSRKRQKLFMELRCFERFINHFFEWQHHQAANDKTNDPDERGNATSAPLRPGAFTLQELEDLPLVEELEFPPAHQHVQGTQKAALAEGGVAQGSSAPNQLLQDHQASPSPGQAWAEHQLRPATGPAAEGDALHSHRVSPAQQCGMQGLQALAAQQHVAQGQQGFPANIHKALDQQAPPAVRVQGHQASPADIQVVQDHQASPADIQVVQGHQASPADIQVVQGHQASPADIRVVQGHQVSPGEVRLVVQELHMPHAEGHVMYSRQVSPLSADQPFMEPSTGGHVQQRHPVPAVPRQVLPGQQVSPPSDQLVPSHQLPRLGAGRGIPKVRYRDMQVLPNQQMPQAAGDQALMTYPPPPAPSPHHHHHHHHFMNHNPAAPANVFHQQHRAPHAPQAAAAPTHQQQQQQQRQQQQDASFLLSHDHFPRPIHSEKGVRPRTLGCVRHSRFRLGLKRTSMMCQVCQVPLCVDCFYPFHVEMMQQATEDT